jgi:hypothetical protein
MNIIEILSKAKQKIQIFGVIGISEQIVNFLNKSKKVADLEVHIFVENENSLFSKSILTDNSYVSQRNSFTDFMFEFKIIADELAYKYKNQTNISIQVCYIDFPAQLILVDNEIYTTNWILSPSQEYKKINEKENEYLKYKEYSLLMLNQNLGKKFSAPYKDFKKDKLTETLELFDENRIKRGVFPRDAFYDSGFIKLVVWVFIFDRKGNMLIHKRDTNAKDNRGMWDKSVGGHADYHVDIETSKTVPREVIEELVTDENIGTSFLQTNDEDIIFMGDWRPDKRKSSPFLEIKNNSDKWVFFRIPEFERTSSPRILKDGTAKGNEVIADTYLFILSEDFDTKKIETFKNSKYKLLHPRKIKSAIEKSEKQLTDENFENLEDLKFTPDLKYTFSSKLRANLESFANHIETYL